MLPPMHHINDSFGLEVSNFELVGISLNRELDLARSQKVWNDEKMELNRTWNMKLKWTWNTRLEWPPILPWKWRLLLVWSYRLRHLSLFRLFLDLLKVALFLWPTTYVPQWHSSNAQIPNDVIKANPPEAPSVDFKAMKNCHKINKWRCRLFCFDDVLIHWNSPQILWSIVNQFHHFIIVVGCER